VKTAVNECGFDMWYLPGYTTSQTQPLDISVMKSFKSIYRELWDAWFEKREGDTSEKPSKDRVIEWTGKAWNQVSKETIMNGWKVYEDFRQEMVAASKNFL
jgi:hypothetical protein